VSKRHKKVCTTDRKEGEELRTLEGEGKILGTSGRERPMTMGPKRKTLRRGSGRVTGL